MEIKFRSWDKHFNEIISAEETEFFNEDGKLVSYYYAGNKHPLFEKGKHIKVYCDLIQYMGRLDKNYNEVYEGDIIKYKNENIVVSRTNIFDIDFNEAEIIGNIYKNKEYEQV